MIKRLLILIFSLIVFLYAFVAFLPKENLFYSLQNELSNKNIVFVNNSINEKLFSLSLQESKLFYDGMKALDIKQTNLNIALFFNKVLAKNLSVDKNFEAFLPTKIDILELSYNVFEPFIIKGISKGEFGKADIFINLSSKKMTLNLLPSSLMKSKYSSTLREFKKVKGVYTYEYKL